MNASQFAAWYPGDNVVAFLLAVAVSVTIVTGLAVLFALPMRKRPALRHGVLLAGLISAGLAPMFVSLSGFTQISLLRVNLPFPIVAETQVPHSDDANDHNGITDASKIIDAQDGFAEVPLPADDQPVPLPFPISVGHGVTDVSNMIDAVVSVPQSNMNLNDIDNLDFGIDRANQRPVWFHIAVTMVSLSWAAGTLLLLARYVVASSHVVMIRQRVKPLPQGLHQVVLEKVMLAMTLKRLPNVGVSQDVGTPVVVGLFRPQIVLPESMLNTLSSDELQEILIHETAHAIRRDLWIVQWEALTLIFCWPIPFVGLLVRELSRTREELCDLYVLKTCDRYDYGQTLLRVARLANNMPPMHMATGILHGPGRLESRIARLLDDDRDESPKISVVLIGMILAVFLLLTGVACGTRLMAEPNREDSSQASPDEAKTLEKIELLGGKITRLEELPGQPVVGVQIEADCKFNEKYFHLLKSLKKLTDLSVMYEMDHDEALISDAGMRQLGELKNLERLDLFSTKISDTGLKEVGRLTNLKSLALCGMLKITDVGFGELSGLKNLTSLDLCLSRVTDDGLKKLGGLKNLEWLRLQGTEITPDGLRELSGLKNLNNLDLVDCKQITDAAAKEIAEFTNLAALNLNGTPITGASLSELKKLKKLQTITMSYSAVTDAGLKDLGELTQVTSLWLCSNPITDVGIKSLEGLRNLQSLILTGTNVTNESIKVLKRLKKLEVIGVADTQITDEAIEELKTALPKLKLLEEVGFVVSGPVMIQEGAFEVEQVADADSVEVESTEPQPVDVPPKNVGAQDATNESRIIKELTLLGCKVTQNDQVPDKPVEGVRFPENRPIDRQYFLLLGSLKNLKSVNVRSSNITDVELKELGKINSLASLNLNETAITDDGLKELGQLKNLTQLRLYGTKVTGVGLKDLGGLRKLRELFIGGIDIEDSALTDEGMKGVAKLQNLDGLFISDSRITDAGLNELRDLKKLRSLFLGGTQITDTGLKVVGEFGNLKELYLRGTHITDAGVKELTKLKQLTSLNVARTAITDASVNGLSKFKQLESLNVSHTRLTGEGFSRLKHALPKTEINDLFDPRW